jgi:hypothetical protein
MICGQKVKKFRHCDGRMAVAIQGHSPFLSFQRADLPPGLPRRFAPRNDEAGGGRARFPSLLIISCVLRLPEIRYHMRPV